jgi:hypothetical protein
MLGCRIQAREPPVQNIRQSSVPGVTPHAWMTASTLRLIPPVRGRMSCCDSCCHSRCNAAPTDECFAQEVPGPVYDSLTCPKYAI